MAQLGLRWHRDLTVVVSASSTHVAARSGERWVLLSRAEGRELSLPELPEGTAELELLSDSMLVQQGDRWHRRDRRLGLYELATGAPRWRLGWGDVARPFVFATSEGEQLYLAHEGEGTRRARLERVALRDGRAQWTLELEADAVRAARLDEEGNLWAYAVRTSARPRRGGLLLRLDAATGREHWRREFAGIPCEEAPLEADPRHAVVACGGEATLLSAATGEVVGRVPTAVSAALGRTALVVAHAGGSLAGYERDATLRERWRRDTFGATAVEGTSLGVLAVQREVALHLLEDSSGAARWSAQGPHGVLRWWLGAPGSPAEFLLSAGSATLAFGRDPDARREELVVRGRVRLDGAAVRGAEVHLGPEVARTDGRGAFELRTGAPGLAELELEEEGLPARARCLRAPELSYVLLFDGRSASVTQDFVLRSFRPDWCGSCRCE